MSDDYVKPPSKNDDYVKPTSSKEEVVKPASNSDDYVKPPSAKKTMHMTIMSNLRKKEVRIIMQEKIATIRELG